MIIVFNMSQLLVTMSSYACEPTCCLVRFHPVVCIDISIKRRIRKRTSRRIRITKSVQKISWRFFSIYNWIYTVTIILVIIYSPDLSCSSNASRCTRLPMRRTTGTESANKCRISFPEIVRIIDVTIKFENEKINE